MQLPASGQTLTYIEQPPEKPRFVIQGFGNVGSNAALTATEIGYKIIAVSDVHGGIYNLNGFAIKDLTRYVVGSGSVIDYPGADGLTNAELLTLGCDVPIPAAMESQIIQSNTDAVRARIVAEGDNGPTRPQGDAILH